MHSTPAAPANGLTQCTGRAGPDDTFSVGEGGSDTGLAQQVLLAALRKAYKTNQRLRQELKLARECRQAARKALLRARQ
ncbi:hypothetical protein CVIRNUC_000233 [Coccomyxa viridis]|uniref:Uncharacterized protein n=1 Tax=Coccomyxa viridis TaxID=1274662 RepID=A0AAV1HQD8_9CHLO|nr:hypothetical protein CVIRNUC_000233 [Coccomyxa viridis]